MPELPELDVVREVLAQRVVGKRIARVELFQPMASLVVRDLTARGFVETLTGTVFENVTRRGKFLLFAFRHPVTAQLALNPKLTGRLQLAAPNAKRHKKTAVAFSLANGSELRYYDDKSMGQLYLTEDLARVPDFARMGPEPFDLTREQFRARLKSYRGEIKGILTRGDFVAGIGNAYADEILWHAQLHPYRKRTQLTPQETDRLYDAMQTILREAIAQVRVAMGENIHLEPRAFFAVHMKTGESCPRCGTTISEIRANQRVTNFCRACQPGGLIRGM
jgi:formamidopyrimidine-DNA glycosylase